MPKIYCYLEQQTTDQLEQIKIDEGYKSSSQVVKEMTNLGIKTYIHSKKDQLSKDDKHRLEKDKELTQHHTMYLLRLLALNADILRFVYDPSKLPDSFGNIEEHLVKINQKMHQFIDGYVKD